MSSGFQLEKFVDALHGVLPQDGRPIGLHEPEFGGNELKYVTQCVKEGWVSSVGKFVDRFEIELAEYTGVKRAVAVVNGTAALHICLLLEGVTRDDEVIIPAMTFVATANAVSYCNAVPHFVDSEERTLGIDAAKLDSYLAEIAVVSKGECVNTRTGRRIRAVVPMHTFGHAVDIDALLEVCSRYKLVLIEDAAESLGTFYKNKHTGSYGSMSALSFNGNKILTTGGGGAILTNDEKLGRLAKHITTTAKINDRWNFVHDMVGYNYRMPNINAALGCGQLEQLSGFLAQKKNLADKYASALKDVDGGKLFMAPEFSKSNYWLNAYLLDPQYMNMRDSVLELTNEQGIMTRPAWKLMYKLPMYSQCPRMDSPVAEDLERRLINLPSSACLGKEYANT